MVPSNSPPPPDSPPTNPPLCHAQGPRDPRRTLERPPSNKPTPATTPQEQKRKRKVTPLRTSQIGRACVCVCLSDVPDSIVVVPPTPPPALLTQSQLNPTQPNKYTTPHTTPRTTLFLSLSLVLAQDSGYDSAPPGRVGVIVTPTLPLSSPHAFPPSHSRLSLKLSWVITNTNAPPPPPPLRFCAHAQPPQPTAPHRSHTDQHSSS